MELYIAIHTHKHGTDIYPVWSKKGEPSTQEVINVCDIDFDDYHEEIEVIGPYSEIPTIEGDKDEIL